MAVHMGSQLGYQGPTDVVRTSRNLPLKCGDEFDLWEKMIKEVKLGRFAGPYKKVPFDTYIQSPAGLVPKQEEGQTRLIFHLSHPHDGPGSINYHTPKELCSIK